MICRAHAARYGAEFVLGSTKEPFSTSAESPAVQALLDTYCEVTGKPVSYTHLDQLMSAETFKILAGKFIDLAKKNA